MDDSKLGLRTTVMARSWVSIPLGTTVDEFLEEGVDTSGLRISLTSRTGFAIVATDKNGGVTGYTSTHNIFLSKRCVEAVDPDRCSPPSHSRYPSHAIRIQRY